LLRSPDDLVGQRPIESAVQQPLVTEGANDDIPTGPYSPEKLVIDEWHSDLQPVRHAHHVDIA